MGGDQTVNIPLDINGCDAEVGTAQGWERKLKQTQGDLIHSVPSVQDSVLLKTYTWTIGFVSQVTQKNSHHKSVASCVSQLVIATIGIFSMLKCVNVKIFWNKKPARITSDHQRQLD